MFRLITVLMIDSVLMAPIKVQLDKVKPHRPTVQSSFKGDDTWSVFADNANDFWKNEKETIFDQ